MTAFKGCCSWRRMEQIVHQILTNQPGKTAWPISGATFILMHKRQKACAGCHALKFFDWAYTTGDKSAADLEYVPLPAAVKDLVRKQWAGYDRCRWQRP